MDNKTTNDPETDTKPTNPEAVTPVVKETQKDKQNHDLDAERLEMIVITNASTFKLIIK